MPANKSSKVKGGKGSPRQGGEGGDTAADASIDVSVDPEQPGQASAEKAALIPDGSLPAYLACAFQDLYEEDGLVVLGRGLGWLGLVAALVRFYADVEHGHLSILLEEKKVPAHEMQNLKPPLVFVLGIRDAELDSLMAILDSWGTPTHMKPAVITNESGQAKDRTPKYHRGGVFCVTSRILIVDLLTQAVSSDDIAGLIVNHADRVHNESIEAFIIRIYTSQRGRNKGFVKAVTDSPESMFTGFAKVDKTLKALFVRNLYLYPRFQEDVKQELEENSPIVVELHQDLSPRMKEIQQAIVAAVQACMRELKKLTPLIQWSSADLAIENCVTSGFDRAVRTQLEPEWHKISPKTKQMVQDLRVLRALFHALVQHDCVSFYKFINSIKSMSAASRTPSMWLLTPAADVLFRKAKERLYKITRGKATASNPNPPGQLKTVLEENPKWRLLKQQLDDIRDKESARMVPRAAKILIMVKENLTVEAVKSYIVEGKDRTMWIRWLAYLETVNEKSRSVAKENILEESKLLCAEENRIRKILFGDEPFKDDQRKVAPGSAGAPTDASNEEASPERSKRQLNEVPRYMRKRRRIVAEQTRGGVLGQREDLERQAVLDEAMEQMTHDLEGYESKFGTQSSSINNDQDDDELSNTSDSMYKSMLKLSIPNAPMIEIRSFADIERDQGGLLLQDIKPDYIIMYDADIAFIRMIEVYSALHHDGDEKLEVTFLVYEASAEQKNFVKSLQREQDAFSRLIHHKKTMPPPMLMVDGTQELQQAFVTGAATSTYNGGTLPLAFDTRRGRGKMRADGERRNIAVDIREFRSALPSILHQGGMRLAPVTLTVGDFVLSNVHCVERKSIGDLYQSFGDGRLYTQAEAMCKYYECPCLLIEFDPEKSFSLQNASEIGAEIRTDSICSKISILIMHFPKLRILWSKSPHETLKIFKALKSNHEEVDLEKAVEVGRTESAESLLERETGEDADGEEEDEINETARDMLLRLPGINVHNARKIMERCDSIAELSAMSREQLRGMLGPVKGQKLFTFFRQSMRSM